MNSIPLKQQQFVYVRDGDRVIYDASVLVPHKITSNWIHPKIGVIHVDENELGMAALSDIPVGALLVVYGGKVYTSKDFDELPISLQKFPYQIEQDLFIGPANDEDIGIGERLNHSCNPTAGFRGEISLIAIRHIQKGELITIDYATCSSNNHVSFDMTCNCHSIKCRRYISGQDWEKPDVISRLFDYYQPYLKRMVLSKELRDSVGNDLPSRNNPLKIVED